MKNTKPNQLINSSSPYLLQHANNPVQWYEWGEEAFAKAVEEDKPIFLSVGYSTCHWCHVMERQSFENEAIAEMMNRVFVNIKVDREERPDIDGVYMNVCQMLTGSGGWPLTIIMTPDKKPFFAATYLPPYTAGGRIGMVDLIAKIDDVWQNKRDAVYGTAEHIIENLKKTENLVSHTEINESVLHGTANFLKNGYDEKYGGFSPAPKFPIPHSIEFLLNYGAVYGSEQVMLMAYRTLDAMRAGGIYDHLGFGFHRYSTDEKWLVPHFEKMLYDQAGLINAYTSAFKLSNNELYKKVVFEIVDYLQNEMSDESGGFYSAEDADSEGVEGKFYVWTADEIRDILAGDAEKFIEIFNVKDDGNFFSEIGEYNNSLNILHLQKIDVLNSDVYDFIEKCRKILYKARKKRIHPLKDDKILTDWNGYLIAAFAKSGFVFKDDKFIESAKSCADFLYENLYEKSSKKLYHRYRKGETGIEGMLDDYAFFSHGLLELYFTTGDIQYLEQAIELSDRAIELFYDNANGGFFRTSSDAELVLVRQKESYDGAMPSANSIMLSVLYKLYALTSNERYLVIIDKTIGTFAEKIQQYPGGYTAFAGALFYRFIGSAEIVLVGDKSKENYYEFLDVIRKSDKPNIVLIYLEKNREIEKYAKWTEAIQTDDNKCLAYYCENFACNLPVDEPEKLSEILKSSRKRQVK